MKNYVDEEIQNALMELCNIKKFDDITVKEIYERSQISKQAFYNHYKDKYEIVEKIYLHDTYFAFHNSADYSHDIFLATMKNFWNRRKYYKNVLESSKQNSLNEFALEESITSLRCILINHRVAVDEAMEFKIRFYSFGYVNCLHQWVKGVIDLDVEEFSEYLYSVIPDFIKGVWS